MNKYAIIGIFVGTIIIVSGLLWLGQPTNQNNQANSNSAIASQLKSDEKVFDFGTISMAKGDVKHEFKIMNNSDKPITLKKISTSCMCTSANFKFNQNTYGPFKMESMGGLTSANITLNPGDNAVAEAVYDPNAHGPAGVGPIDRFIYLEDADGGQLTLEIKAVVTP